MTQPDTYDPELGALEHVDVRVMPAPPMGGRPALDASRLAEFGAMAGSQGIEHGRVVALVNRIQSTAAKTTLEMLPELLKLVRETNDARIHRIMQAVRNLPEAPLQPQGIWASLNGRNQPLNSYVGRNEVLAILAQALVENPT